MLQMATAQSAATMPPPAAIHAMHHAAAIKTGPAEEEHARLQTRDEKGCRWLQHRQQLRPLQPRAAGTPSAGLCHLKCCMQQLQHHLGGQGLLRRRKPGCEHMAEEDAASCSTISCVHSSFALPEWLARLEQASAWCNACCVAWACSYIHQDRAC